MLEDKHILITGATRGIGLASARLCLDQGATVWLNGRDPDVLDGLVDELGPHANGLVYDVTDEKEVKSAFLQIQKQGGKLDGLVNNAGVMQDSVIGMTPLSGLQKMLQVNVVAVYQHLQLASRLMGRKKSGSIINLCSAVGEQGSAGQSAYAATKAAVSGLTKSAAKELAGANIRVNGVAPGFIDTDLVAGYQNAQRQAVIDSIPLAKAGQPDDVARQIVYLLSEQSRYITGQIIAVDGGLRL